MTAPVGIERGQDIAMTASVATEATQEGLTIAAIEGSRWQASGGPFAQLYDPPFTIPFLRRNEVAVRVAPRS
jgi:hypothetical protein